MSDHPHATEPPLPDELQTMACPICGDLVFAADVEAHMLSIHPKAVRPPGWQDLNPALPETVIVHGVPCPVERVKLDDLEDWGREHGVSLLCVAWMGALGWVSIYGKDSKEEEQCHG
jgi:hypothetical protein